MIYEVVVYGGFMPHLILEYSDNILEDFKPEDFFAPIHHILSTDGPYLIENLKSRSVRHSDYFVMDGYEGKAFIHLNLSVLDGRDPGIFTKLGPIILAYLERYFSVSRSKLACSVSFQIMENPRLMYFKSAN